MFQSVISISSNFLCCVSDGGISFPAKGSAFRVTVGEMEHASSYEAMGFRVLNQVHELSPKQPELQNMGVSTHNLKIKAPPILGLRYLQDEVLPVCL
jgi:hypothetical protein